ncbi:MAG: hypothetical protein H8E87_01860 [FCB group bacterium]|nr:hypothetical protein [FCB group bacterium]
MNRLTDIFGWVKKRIASSLRFLATTLPARGWVKGIVLEALVEFETQRSDMDKVRPLIDIPMKALMTFKEASYYFFVNLSLSHFKKMMDPKTAYYKPKLAKIFEMPYGRKRGWMVQRRALEYYIEKHKGKFEEVGLALEEGGE